MGKIRACSVHQVRQDQSCGSLKQYEFQGGYCKAKKVTSHSCDELSGGLPNSPSRFAFVLRYATGSATKLKPENSRSRSVGVASRQAPIVDTLVTVCAPPHDICTFVPHTYSYCQHPQFLLLALSLCQDLHYICFRCNIHVRHRRHQLVTSLCLQTSLPRKRRVARMKNITSRQLNVKNSGNTIRLESIRRS